MFVNWLAVVLIIGFGVVGLIVGRKIMGQLDDVVAAVDAARTEQAKDKADIIAEIQRLQVSQAEKDALIAKVQEFGTAFDDVPGVTPHTEPPVEPPVEPPIEPTP